MSLALTQDIQVMILLLAQTLHELGVVFFVSSRKVNWFDCALVMETYLKSLSHLAAGSAVAQW